MNSDDFEKELRRQPLRSPPGEWRAEILAAARSAAEQPTDARSALTVVHSPLAMLRALLWPCPSAWAGLAAVWLVILGVNFATTDRVVTVARQTPPPSREMMLALRKQEREFARLIQPFEQPAGESRKSSPSKPRGDVRPATTIAYEYERKLRSGAAVV